MARIAIPQTVAEWNQRGKDYLPEDAEGRLYAHSTTTCIILGGNGASSPPR